jgi:hypothetical protein
MHIKKVLIKGFKAIRMLDFGDEFSPGHNVISECWTDLARCGEGVGGAARLEARVGHMLTCVRAQSGRTGLASRPFSTVSTSVRPLSRCSTHHVPCSHSVLPQRRPGSGVQRNSFWLAVGEFAPGTAVALVRRMCGRRSKMLAAERPRLT